MKHFRAKRLILVAAVVVSGVLALLPATGAFAATTTADVAVTATGSYVSFTCNASSYNFGTINAASTTNTSAGYFGFTNTSSVATNISVKMLATTWTSAGSGWTHSDTAAGSNTAAMMAGSNNGTPDWGTAVFVKFAAPANQIVGGLAAGNAYKTGLSLLAPTDFTDGLANNNTVRFTIYSAT